jgi:hypothetical protein
MIVVVLVVLALIAGAGGLAASNMIQTIGFVGIGCLFGILARIAQSRAQHRALMVALREANGRPGASPAPNASPPPTQGLSTG